MKICASKHFASAPDRRTLLWYLVDETLKHPQRNPVIKGVSIGIEVFKKAADFDPKKDTRVKGAMGELREKLDVYYQEEEHHAVVSIEIPPKTYTPKFTLLQSFSPLELDQQAINNLVIFRRSMEERTGNDDMVARMFLVPLMEKYPRHPQLLSLEAMRLAIVATYNFTASPVANLRDAEIGNSWI